jgi:phosphoserine phosphatase
LIGTKLEVKDGILTGQLATKNCYGSEKVRRIREIYNIDECEHIYAYGDSRGDKELLDFADESFYQFFG